MKKKKLRVIRESQLKTFMKSLKERASAHNKKGTIHKTVEKILFDVKKNGDKAVKKYTEKFDSVKLRKLSIDKSEIEATSKKAGKDFLKALEISAQRIRAFHKYQREKSWYFSEEGVLLGHIIRPLERVGVYVPGGKAPYPSTVLMNVIPAQVAGVKEIAVCVPTPEGMLNPSVAAALRLLRIKEVYRVGGVQAIAAMAYGTETIKKQIKSLGLAMSMSPQPKKWSLEK